VHAQFLDNPPDEGGFEFTEGKKMRSNLLEFTRMPRGCDGAVKSKRTIEIKITRMGWGWRTGIKGRDVVTSCILLGIFFKGAVTRVVTRRD
jgi:hypothetical protein